jgi:hypothetical protein
MSQSDKQLAGNQRRSLRAMSAKLLRMAEEWDGVDQFNLSQLMDLADKVESVAAEMITDDPP